MASPSAPAPSAARERQRRRRERAQIEAALGRFAVRGPLSFRQIAELDAAEFDLLLALLDEALGASRRPDGSRKSRTADGRLTVALHPPDESDEAPVTLVTPRGRLCCRNYRIVVEEVSATDARVAAAGLDS